MTNDWAIVVLPEIFGVNGFVGGVVERLGKTHGVPAYAVDFFFPVTGQHKVYDYVADREEAHHAMTEVSNDVFLKYFTAELDRIQSENSALTKFAVVGFCFGGRLAYLAGTDPRVLKVVSFYGSRAADSVAILASTRANSNLKVLSFYGGTDASITESDRNLTAKALTDAGIKCQAITYSDAGHAFMNNERTDRYHEKSALDATEELDTFLESI